MERWKSSIPAWVGYIFFIMLLLLSITGSAQAQRPNGAGLIIQHGDGTLIYVYVPFEEDSISGEELLASSALAIEVDVFGGLGMAVCSLNGEGCPPDDCFCQSYSDPANFWHFYTWTSGGWSENPLGVSTRTLVDGDIDGWSWNAGAHSLPLVTIDEIASVNGFDRRQPDPTATLTPVPSPSPTLTPTVALTATTLLPTATPQPTLTQLATETSTTSPVPTESISVATSTSLAIQTPTLTSSPWIKERLTAPISPSSTPDPTVTNSPGATIEPVLQAAAVIVTPGATPQPLPVSDAPESSTRSTLVLFATVFGIVILVGLFLVLRFRQPTRP